MPPRTGDKENPKTHSYANALYELMDGSAVSRVISGSTYKVWEGSLTKTCQSLGIPKGVERRVTKLLEELSAIEILQRGQRTYPSVVALLGAPTADGWRNYRERRLTDRPTGARLAVEVRSIKESLGGVDLRSVLMNFEQRISELETAVKELSGKK